jgi:outer membrane receptor for ferrienterochelin and colicins
LAYFNDREKLVPTSWYGTTFNGRGTKVADGRGFVEAAYQHAVGAAGELKWRIYYDQYRYTGRYDYSTDDSPLDQRDGAKGDWAGTQLTYRFRAPWAGFFTVGSEASWDFRSLQFLYQSAPVYQNLLYINRLNRSYAIFFQQEWNLSKHWKTYLGGRMDDSRNHPTSLTPRLALIYQPSPANAVKFLYGRSFRNPNSFEQFYDDSGSSQIPNPGLRAERMQTFEVAFERRLSSKLELLANAYRYRLDDVITAVPITDTEQQFRNVATGRTTGFELEASARLGPRIRANASMAVQRTGAATSEYLEVNSPTRVGKLRFEIPVFKDRWSLSSGLHYLSERETTAGSTVPAVYLVDLVLASRRLPGGLEIQGGAHNLLNYRYWDPVGLQLNTDRLLQDGRNIFLQLSWSSSRPKDEAQRSGPAQP